MENRPIGGRGVSAAIVALLFCVSLTFVPSSAQANQPSPASAASLSLSAGDPSVTIVAGCSTATPVVFSAEFGDLVTPYLTQNPTIPRDFRHGSYLPCPGSSPTPADVPPVFFLRGVTFVIAAKCAACTFSMSAIVLRPDPSVQTLTPTRINDTAFRVSIPADAGIGLYQFTGTFGPAACADSFTGNFWVIFNAAPGSPDVQVNGLNGIQYFAYVLSKTDFAYFGVPSPGGSGVRDIRGVTRGKAVNFTLGPQKAVVYLKAMALVDAARAWKSARLSVNAMASGASAGLPSGWPPGPGTIFDTSWNVPTVLERISAGSPLCGQCMVYGSIADALSRSIGVPTRMVTTINSIVGVKGTAGAWTWNFHVWDEVWLNEVTSRNWSAFDPSSGTAFGHTAVTPVNPTARTNAVFANRFAMGSLPGAAAGVCPCRSVAWVTGALGTRVDVTSAYRNPLPDPVATPGVVSVSFDRPSYTFGENVFATVTVTNPNPFSVSPAVDATLAAEDFEGINLEGPWPVSTITTTFVIPPESSASQTLEFTSGQYVLNGDFVVLASADFGSSSPPAIGYNFATISSGLLAQLTAPSSVKVNQLFDVEASATNALSTSISDATVIVFLPDSLTTSSPTEFTIASLAPGQTDSFVIPVTTAIPDFQVLTMEASAPSAGVSLSSPVSINATDPSSSSAVGGVAIESGSGAVTESASTLVSMTCSISSAVPQFDVQAMGFSSTTVFMAALGVVLVVLTGHVVSRRQSRSGSRT